MESLKNLLIVLTGTVIGTIVLGILAYISTLLLPDLMIEFSHAIGKNQESNGSEGKQLILGISLTIGAFSGFAITSIPLLFGGMKNIFSKGNIHD